MKALRNETKWIVTYVYWITIIEWHVSESNYKSKLNSDYSMLLSISI